MRILQTFVLIALFAFVASFSVQAQSRAELLDAWLKDLEKRQTERNERINQYIELHPEILDSRSLDPNNVMILEDVIDGQPIFKSTHNFGAMSTTYANRLHVGGETGADLSGQGVIVGVWDGGIARESHQEFSGRITIAEPTLVPDGHATHVLGTISAGGVNFLAKGVAPECNSISYNFDNDVQEMFNESFDNDMVLSNHSYGTVSGWDNGTWRGGNGADEDWKFGFYNEQAKDWDNIVFFNPIRTIVKSSGNDNGDSGGAGASPGPDGPWDIISTYGTAKNIITVGATLKALAGYKEPSDIAIASFSSTGPTDDGRIKPDIVAPGVGITSTESGSNNAYGARSGTSMSTPHVTGVIALLQEYAFNQTGDFARADLIKAALLHSAFECGTAPGPDYRFGWGLVNPIGALSVLNPDAPNITVIDTILTEGADFNFTFDPIVDKNIKATLVWLDPPGSPAAISIDPTDLMLVNDLDMRISDGVGTIYEPWILDPQNPAGTATTGDNFRDNVEQIVVGQAAPETYTLNISHKGNSLVTDEQRFILVIQYDVEGTTSTNDLSPDLITMYPNPVKDKFTIMSADPSLQLVETQIFDMTGRLVQYAQDIDAVDVSMLNTGMYVAYVYTNRGVIKKRFAKM